MPPPDRSAIGRSSKRRGASDELAIAKKLGTERYPADVGGPLDLKPVAGLTVQIKGGKTVATVAMREALASARAGAVMFPGHLPTVILRDRRERRIQDWICFDLDDYIEWHGLNKTLHETGRG